MVNFEYRYMLDFLFDVHCVGEYNDRVIINSRFYIGKQLDRCTLTNITLTFLHIMSSTHINVNPKMT